MRRGDGGLFLGRAPQAFLQDYQERKQPPLAQRNIPQPLRREGLAGDSLKCDPFLLAVPPWKEAEMPLGCKGITVHSSTIACELGGLNLRFCEPVLPSDCSFSILYIKFIHI